MLRSVRMCVCQGKEKLADAEKCEDVCCVRARRR